MSTVKTTFAFLALLAVIFGLTPVLHLRVGSEISEAVVKPITDTPWSTAPRKIIYDVQDGHDVYEWLYASFLPALFEKSTTANGMVMLARYNRPLHMRLSMKRVKQDTMASTVFVNAYAQRWVSSQINAFGYDSWAEDTEPFGDLDDNSTTDPARFDYMHHGGFNDAGAFTEYFDLRNETDVRSRFALLDEYHWFDLNQGSFALEFLTYNGNVDLFCYIYFTFEQIFSGQTKVTVSASPLNMSLNDSRNAAFWEYMTLYILYFALLLFIGTKEIQLMTSDLIDYCRHPARVITFGMLLVYWITAIMYAKVIISHAYFNFNFREGEDLMDNDMFDNMIDLARQFEQFAWWFSWTIMITVLKNISLLGNVTQHISLLSNVLQRMIWQLLTYLGMCSVLLIGFAVAGNTLFGIQAEHWGTFTMAFLSCLRMLMGEANMDELLVGDRVMGEMYFFAFHTLFFILNELFLAIVLCFYTNEVVKNEFNAYQNEFKNTVRHAITLLKQEISLVDMCMTRVQQRFFGQDLSGGSTNYDEVAALQEKRATNRPTRKVVYDKDKRKSDDKDNKEINVDDEDHKQIPDLIELDAQRPKNPHGHMNYYVKKPDSASEAGNEAKQHLERNGICPGYRLIGIHSEDGEWDRLRFRQRWTFEEKYNSRTKDMLQIAAENHRKAGHVTLDFEGWISPVSRECCGLVCLLVCFLFFAGHVSRVNDSHSLFALRQLDLVRDPTWESSVELYDGSHAKEHFEDISDLDQVRSWIQAAVVEKEYSCVEEIGHAISCKMMRRQKDKYVDLSTLARYDWALWNNSRISPLPPPYLPDLGNSTRPAYESNYASPGALGSLSTGYVPYLPPDSGIAQVAFHHAVKAHSYNTGIMPHNHMRLTFQVSCFKENTNDKVSMVYPYVMVDEFTDPRRCSDEDCMRRFLKSRQWQKDGECFDIEGVGFDPTSFAGFIDDGSPGSGMQYTYNDGVGTFKSLGGIAIGFGNTAREADEVLKILEQDGIFQSNVISVAVEMVLYNENLKLFTYSSVSFTQRATGHMVSEVATRSVPLATFTRGAGETISMKVLIVFCLICYLGFMIAFTIHFLWCVFFLQRKITHLLMKERSMFWWHFLRDDYWNIIDTATTVLNLTITVSLFLWLLMMSPDSWDGSFGLWREGYKFSTTATMSTIDPFDAFEKTGRLWNVFVHSCAFNAFFIFIRLIKYLYGFEPLRLMLKSLASSASESLTLMGVFLIIVFTFGVTFWLRFGGQTSAFGTMEAAFTQILLFFCGFFDKGRALVRRDPMFFTFLLLHLFVIVKVTLGLLFAVNAYAWLETRKDAQKSTLDRSLSILTVSLRSMLPKKYKEKATDLEVWLLKRLKAGDSLNTEAMGEQFWKEHSAIEYFRKLDRKGKIQNDNDADKRSEASEEDSDASSSADDDDHHHHVVNKGDRLQTKLTKNFKRAYMRIATEMCKEDERRERENTEAKRRRAGGVNLTDIDEEKQSQGEEKQRQSDDRPKPRDILLGMVDENQPKAARTVIDQSLNNTVDVTFFQKGDRVKVHPSARLNAQFVTIREDDIGEVTNVQLKTPETEGGDVPKSVIMLDVRFPPGPDPERMVLRDVEATDMVVWYKWTTALDDLNLERTSILDRNQYVQELWFDALLTACEQADVVKGVRKMLGSEEAAGTAANKLKEWKGSGRKWKKIVKRLDLFVRWVEQEAECKHLSVLRTGTEAREKKVKCQTLALNDYLDKLNERIAHLEGEVKAIDRKVNQYDSMRVVCGGSDVSKEQREYEAALLSKGTAED
jgi:hypothetical protein